MKDEIFYLRLGRRLRRRRRQLDMTQAQVAHLCGTTFQQVQKYESGLTAISVGRLVRLAEALQMPVSSLFEPAIGPPAAPEVRQGDAFARGRGTQG